MQIIDTIQDGVRTVRAQTATIQGLRVYGTFVALAHLDGTWTILQPFTVWRDDRQILTVPSGFLTDLLSSPQWAWWFEPKTSPRWIHASAVHDYLYDPACPVACTRADADAYLRDLAALQGVSWGHRWMVWAMVRVLGGRYWKNFRSAIPR